MAPKSQQGLVSYLPRAVLAATLAAFLPLAATAQTAITTNTTITTIKSNNADPSADRITNASVNYVISDDVTLTISQGNQMKGNSSNFGTIYNISSAGAYTYNIAPLVSSGKVIFQGLPGLFATTTTGSKNGGAFYLNGSWDIDVTINLTNAKIADFWANGDGGAIYANNGKFTINLTNFEVLNNSGTNYSSGGNAGTEYGGAIALTGSGNSSITLNNGTFASNMLGGYAGYSTTAYGGAASVIGANVTGTDVKFNENSIVNSGIRGSYASGGALYVSPGSFTVTNTVSLTKVAFTGNKVSAASLNASQASAYGGAIFDTTATLIINGGTFASNGAYIKTTGDATTRTATAYGGAIYLTSASSTMNNILFSSNTASADTVGISAVAGGAIYLNTANLTMTNAVFSHNAVYGGNLPVSGTLNATGGAIMINGLSTLIVNSGTFEYNTVTGTGGALQNLNGGAIYQADSKAISRFTDVKFSNNYAQGNGGAIFYGSTTSGTLSTVAFVSNSAALDGGALYVDGKANIVLENVSFESNRASRRAGAMSVTAASTVTINGGTFANNRTDTVNGSASTGMGGAIFASDVSTLVTLNDVLFEGNIAKGGSAGYGRGGAIYVNTGVVTLNLTKDMTYIGNIAAGPASAGNESSGAIADQGGFAYLRGANGTLNINVATDKTLTIGSAANVNADTIASHNTDTQYLVINETAGNTGAVVLHGDNTGYTSMIQVKGGSLLLGNKAAALGGNLSVDATATFGGLGHANNVSLADGATMIVGYPNIGATTSSTLTIGGTLTSAANNTFKYNIHSPGVTDLLSIETLASGGLGTGSKVDLNSIQAGTYTLMRLTGGETFTSDTPTNLGLTFNGGSGVGRVGHDYILDSGDTELLLTLTIDNYARNWVAGTIWNSSSNNWSGDGGDSLFLTGDRVNFSTAVNENIAVADTGVIAADMTVNTANTYTFTGGRIVTDAASTLTAGAGDDMDINPATGKLVKNGTGTLILANTATNNFTAGITVNSGTLQGTADTLHAGVEGINLAASTADLVFNQTADAAYTGTITGAGNLTKQGAGNLTLNNTTDYTGATNLAAGQITLAAVNQIASSSAVTLAASTTLNTGGLNQTLQSLTGSGNINTASNAAATIVLNNTAANTYAGVIAGAASVEKTGAGNLTITANQTYTGTTTITTGTLQLGDGIANTGNLAGAIDNNATLVINHGTHSGTMANALTGANTGVITKLGTGDLTYTGNGSTYAGTVNAANSRLWLATGAQLGGNITAIGLGGAGTATGNATISNGGSIIIGATHSDDAVLAPEHLIIGGTLALDTTTIKLDVYGVTGNDSITSGWLTHTGITTIDLNASTTGNYTLITLTSGTFDNAILANLSTTEKGGTLSGRSTDSYSLSGDSKSLILDLITKNFVITWSGTNGSTWINNNTNWAASGTADQFVTGDKVIFDDTAQAGSTLITIDIDNGVRASDLVVTGTTNYTFAGGIITTNTANTGLLQTATATLTKDGAGTLTFSNSANSFVGGINLNAGTIRGNVDTLQAGTVGINNNGTLVFDQALAGTYTAAIIGTGSLSKEGAGKLTLNNTANTYSGGINVTGGELELLNSGNATRSALNIGTGATLTIDGDNTAYTIQNALTGSGTLAINMAGTAAAVAITSAAGDTYAGTLKLGASTFTLDTGAATALTHATLALGAGNTTNIASGTHHIAGLVINGGNLAFSATIPADAAAQGIIQTDNLAIGTSGTIQVALPTSAPNITPTPAGKVNIFSQDEVTGGALLVKSSAPVTGNISNLVLVNETGAVSGTGGSSATRNVNIVEGANTVAKATYDYSLGTGASNDGLYVGYALTALEIQDAQTLHLAPDAGADAAGSELHRVMISGSGHLDIDATNGLNATVTISNTNYYMGETKVSGGTVKLGSDNALGHTSKLTLVATAGLDLDGKHQTIGTIDTAAGSTLNLGTNGALTLTNGGTTAGTLRGTGTITFQMGNYAIHGANTSLAAASHIGSAVNVTLQNTLGLGTGSIVFDAANSALTLAGSGILNNALVSATTGAGSLIIDNHAQVTLGGNSPAYSGQVDLKSGDLIIPAGISLGSASVKLTPDSRVQYNGLVTANYVHNFTGTGGTVAFVNNSHVNIANTLPSGISLEVDATSSGTLPTDTHLKKLALDGYLNFAYQATGSFKTLTIDKIAGNGTIVMNVDLGKKIADKLIINETGDSPTLHNIAINKKETKRATADTVITLVQSADPDATFKIEGPAPVSNTNLLFELNRGGPGLNITDPGTWYLAAGDQLSQTAGAIINTVSLLGTDWHYELDSLSKRMGNVRQELANLPEGQKPGGNLWMRGNAYHVNGNAQLGGYAFEQNTYGLTVGADKAMRSEKSFVLAGIFAGMTNTKRTFDNSGEGTTDGINGGVYVTWLHNRGWYADITAKTDRYKNEFTARTADGYLVDTGEYSNQAYGASVEFGRFFQGETGWWCEIAAQAAVGIHGSLSYTTADGTEARADSGTDTQLRAKARWGRNFTERLNIWLQGALVKSTTSGGEISVSDSTYAPDFDGIRTEFGIGTSYALSKRSQLWIDYEYTKAENYTRPWSVNVGLRFLW